MQADLFSYPGSPGAKGNTPATLATSEAAAAAVKPSAATIREAVAKLYRGGFEGSPDRAAARLGLERHNVRSRCSELIADKILEPTGEKETNDSGKPAAILRAR